MVVRKSFGEKAFDAANRMFLLVFMITTTYPFIFFRFCFYQQAISSDSKSWISPEAGRSAV